MTTTNRDATRDVSQKQKPSLKAADGGDIHYPPSDFTVEDSISKELLQLSVETRNSIYEEIHGVHCRAVKETPELVEWTSREFDRELMNLARERRRRRVEGKTNSNSNSNQSNIHNRCYLNDPKIRLGFLRCEFFDVKRALRRFVLFLEYASKIFGDFVSDRPIQVSDFAAQDERTALRNSRQQILPFRDRSGRQVFVSVGDCGFDLDAVLRNKIRLFQCWTAMHEDEETQRKGIVVVSWPSGDAWSEILKTRLSRRDQEENQLFADSKPVRFASFHLCFQDTPLNRSPAALCIFSLDSQTRAVTKIHFGEHIEIRDSLQGYGIPVDLIPLSQTNNVKTTNHMQWINALYWKQKLQENVTDTTATNEIVLCPNFYDVLSRKGQRYTNNPGNTYFRGLVDDASGKHELASRVGKCEITRGILHEIERRGDAF
eukprot:jgi/Psemu1/201165/e_gw1.273.3.1